MKIEFSIEKELQSKIKEIEKAKKDILKKITKVYLLSESCKVTVTHIFNPYIGEAINYQHETAQLSAQESELLKQLNEFRALSLSEKLQMEIEIQNSRLNELEDELSQVVSTNTPTRGTSLGLIYSPAHFMGSLENIQINAYHLACADIKRDIEKTKKKIKMLQEEFEKENQPANC